MTFEKVEGTDFELPCELVLLAMGFVGPQRAGPARAARRRAQRARQRDPRRRVPHEPRRTCSSAATWAAARASSCGPSPRAARARPRSTSSSWARPCCPRRSRPTARRCADRARARPGAPTRDPSRPVHPSRAVHPGGSVADGPSCARPILAGVRFGNAASVRRECERIAARPRRGARDSLATVREARARRVPEQLFGELVERGPGEVRQADRDEVAGRLQRQPAPRRRPWRRTRTVAAVTVRPGVRQSRPSSSSPSRRVSTWA